VGMFTAKNFILSKLNSATYDERLELSKTSAVEFKELMMADLAIIRNPYVAIGIVIVVFMIIIAFTKMPSFSENKSIHFKESIKRLLKRKRYTHGVIAQFFYVGAQILCWTFIIQYGESIGMSREEAQGYNIIAMVLFVSSRFVTTFLMKYISAGKLLTFFGMGAVICTVGVVLLPGIAGLYSLVCISIFMSLMFPTIYGIALQGVGEDSKFGAAGLIMAILGGSVLPPLQALIFDLGGPGFNDIHFMGMNEVKISFIIPLICLAVVLWYGFKTMTEYEKN
jgi:FHS family L-fucose permease-like MFS transporter